MCKGKERMQAKQTINLLRVINEREHFKPFPVTVYIPVACSRPLVIVQLGWKFEAGVKHSILDEVVIISIVHTMLYAFRYIGSCNIAGAVFSRKRQSIGGITLRRLLISMGTCFSIVQWLRG